MTTGVLISIPLLAAFGAILVLDTVRERIATWFSDRRKIARKIRQLERKVESLSRENEALRRQTRRQHTQIMAQMYETEKLQKDLERKDKLLSQRWSDSTSKTLEA